MAGLSGVAELGQTPDGCKDSARVIIDSIRAAKIAKDRGVYRQGMTTDPAAASATFEILSQDVRVRISRWTFETGQSTGMHVHEFDYTAIPITGGRFEATMPDGSTAETLQQAGVPYSRERGVHHDVRFVGDGTAQFVEIEYLA